MSSRTTRIAKNTLMLYFRQLITILISLLTVRLVLNTLGAEDFGTYNVVSGVAVMFTFLNDAMSNATMRFLTFSLGQKDLEQARNIYSIGIIIHLSIAFLFIIITETIGLFIFNNWLNIPIERKTAAFIVYQVFILITVVNIIQTIYNITIISHEKMSFFALTSILEVFLKLCFVYILSFIIFDKLIFYSFFIFLVTIIIFIIHKIFCNKTFEISHFRFCKDKKLFRQLIEFSGWSVFSNIALTSRSHGTNIIINIFFDVTVNAAMGIATQVNNAVFRFVDNFQTAFRPQITKSYASKDYDFFMQLIFQTSKASYFLLFFFVLPLFINAEFVLQLWLDKVPEYTVLFTKLFLLYFLIEAILGPFWMSIQATGDIKKYQITLSCFIFLNLPLSLIFLWLGFSPIWVLIIRIILAFFSLIWFLSYTSKMINLSIKKYFSKVIIPIISISAISSILTLYLSIFFVDFTRLLFSCIISIISNIFLIYFIGLTNQEKLFIKNWFAKRLNRQKL